MPITDPDHRRAWDLIPWVAAGSATAADAALVHSHLAGCADCQAELVLQLQVRAGLLQGAAEPHGAEPALQRLLARIDAAPVQGQPAPAQAPPWTRWLVAAVLVQAVALAAAGAALWQRGETADYRTLAATTATPARIRLVPAPGLDFGALQQLLARHGLVLVQAQGDGQSIALGAAPASGTAPDMPTLLRALRAEPGVLLAEPVAMP